MNINQRPYRNERDLAAMIQFLSTATSSAPDFANFHLGDLLWGMYQNTVFEPQQNIQLWEQNDTLIGFAWADPPMVVALEIAPRLRGAGIVEPMMLNWAEQHVRDLPRPDDQPPTLWVRTIHSAASLIGLLLEQGYQPGNEFAFVMRRELATPIPYGKLPNGFIIRPVGGEQEWAARVATHREVWHPSRVSLDAYRRLRTAPGYRSDLDLVAVAPDGSFAAYCICWLDPVNKLGEFEPVGTRAAFRGRGIGKAVIFEGLRQLREHGAAAAIVYSESNNPASFRLYHSAGFAPVAQHQFYWKQL